MAAPMLKPATFRAADEAVGDGESTPLGARPGDVLLSPILSACGICMPERESHNLLEIHQNPRSRR